MRSKKGIQKGIDKGVERVGLRVGLKGGVRRKTSARISQEVPVAVAAWTRRSRVQWRRRPILQPKVGDGGCTCRLDGAMSTPRGWRL